MHRAQGKPQPDAHGWRELEGETAKSERVNDRKITADGKEGPGDRSGEAYLCIPPAEARLRWRHGTARTRHDGFIPENPQGHAPHGRVKAEPPATSLFRREQGAHRMISRPPLERNDHDRHVPAPQAYLHWFTEEHP